MIEFNLLFPKKIVFGNNSIEKLKELEIPGTLGLIITGKNFFKKTTYFKKIKNFLKENKKVIYFFSDVEPEVSVETVDRAANFAREKKIEFIIGIGGGSALDCAKAVAGIAKENFSVKDYLDNKVTIKKDPLFFIAIPTTAGTGTEVTKNAVLTYTEKEIKISLRSEKLVPQIAILDPVLTLTLPPNITAYTGMDALCHAVESYFSVGANTFTKFLASKAIKIILKNIFKAYKNGKNLQVRENMLYASFLAGVSFANAGLGAVHGISHPLGAILKLPHGLTNAILLPFVIEFNKKVIKKELEKLEKEINFDLIETIKNLNKKMKIPENFSKIDKNFYKKFDLILSKIDFNSGSITYNPIKMDVNKVKSILNKVF